MIAPPFGPPQQPEPEAPADTMRHFPGGATRDLADHKIDPEGALSPRVLLAYCEYMRENQETAGGRRNSDNWQAGFPADVTMKSALRHMMAFWAAHRDGWVDMGAAFGVLFNVMAHLDRQLKLGNRS